MHLPDRKPKRLGLGLILGRWEGRQGSLNESIPSPPLSGKSYAPFDYAVDSVDVESDDPVDEAVDLAID